MILPYPLLLSVRRSVRSYWKTSLHRFRLTARCPEPVPLQVPVQGPPALPQVLILPPLSLLPAVQALPQQLPFYSCPLLHLVLVHLLQKQEMTRSKRP